MSSGRLKSKRTILTISCEMMLHKDDVPEGVAYDGLSSNSKAKKTSMTTRTGLAVPAAWTISDAHWMGDIECRVRSH